MLYGLVRLVIWGCIFAGAYYWIVNKSKIIKKKIIVVISLVLCLIIGTFSNLIPVENLFISFKTPESVLWYFQGGKVVDVVHGNESSMVISWNKRNSSINPFVVPRSTNGYKIPSVFSVRIIFCESVANGLIDTIYSVLGSNDYYFIGSAFSDKEVSIIDSNGKDVQLISEWFFDSYSILFFGYIESLENDYYLLIDGEKEEIVVAGSLVFQSGSIR